MRKNSGVSKINFNLYHYAGNNPVKYTDPDGRINWDTVSKGISNIFTGISKIVTGVGVLGASGAGEVVTGGSATPLAVVGCVLGGGLVANGYVQSSIGIAEVIAGLTDNSDEENKYSEIPDTLNETLAVPIDTSIELITNKESTTAGEAAEFIDKNIPPSNSVLDLLATPTPLYEEKPPQKFEIKLYEKGESKNEESE